MKRPWYVRILDYFYLRRELRLEREMFASPEFQEALEQFHKGESDVIRPRNEDWGTFVDAMRDWTPSGDPSLAEDLAAVRAVVQDGADRDPWDD